MLCSPEWRAIYRAYGGSAAGGSSSNGQRDDLAVQLAVLDRKPSHRNRQIEPPRAGAAGVEIEHAVLGLHFRPMRVAGDYGTETGRRRIEIEVLENVQHVETNAAVLDDLALRQALCPSVPV